MKVVFGDDRPDSYQPDLFDREHVWQSEARAWARAHGETVERFGLGGRFRVAGTWYRIDWSDLSDQWCVERI